MIRRFQEADAAPFFALRNIEVVARYQGWPFPFPEENCAAFMEEMTTSHPDIAGTWFQFALEACETGNLVGDIGIHTDVQGEGEVEIGFSLHPDYQGKGLMSEALTALFDYLFNKRGKSRIKGIVDTRNPPSSRLLERMGFLREKTMKTAAEGNEAPLIEHVYILNPLRWRASQKSRT